ncbi:SRPBCC domain-containing protein [Ruania halotolerans]|uniref:SRPBCC domain-containing protein n=1 Tax=Ruania halotolerans TaxID=2897773 RepID=UPI001E4E81C1|nr:SRPBCC domain-containing protein [Ruania halotolerans]UFU07789.1 SRPBCC domain-containing protein [Ruania halotolerans]
MTEHIATSNTAAVADTDAGTITRTITIDAPREKVWEALATPENIEAWWDPVQFPDGWRAGSLGSFFWEGKPYPVRLDVVRPPEELAFTWGDLEGEIDATSTTVQFTLAEHDGGTRLRVHESGFLNKPAAQRRAAMEENTSGWNAVLDSLAEFVTTNSLLREGTQR